VGPSLDIGLAISAFPVTDWKIHIFKLYLARAEDEVKIDKWVDFAEISDLLRGSNQLEIRPVQEVNDIVWRQPDLRQLRFGESRGLRQTAGQLPQPAVDVQNHTRPGVAVGRNTFEYTLHIP
jgi:hypothetical protein